MKGSLLYSTSPKELNSNYILHLNLKFSILAQTKKLSFELEGTEPLAFKFGFFGLKNTVVFLLFAIVFSLCLTNMQFMSLNSDLN